MSYGGGPHGLGDPRNKSLRKVEKEVAIPKQMKKNAQKICKTECQAFSECGKKHGLLLPFMCRKENSVMNDCIIALFKDQKFWDDNTAQYLEERTLYRSTGLTKKERAEQARTA